MWGIESMWLKGELSLDFVVARVTFNAQSTSICSSSGLLVFLCLGEQRIFLNSLFHFWLSAVLACLLQWEFSSMLSPNPQ